MPSVDRACPRSVWLADLVMSKLYVINARGEREPFSFAKVYESARRAGASSLLARRIAKEIEDRVYPDIRTRQIYAWVRGLLKKENKRVAIRFSLKKAIQKLGPTGFPFEKYIGAIFQNFGFNVKLNQHLQGRCLKYEIDFLAENKKVLYVGECKYRQSLEKGKVHSYVALANYARFLDLKDGFLKQKKFENLRIKSILVTEGRFTKDALNFCRCRQVELLGWRYPRNRGLEYLVESQGLYPITILPSLRLNVAKVFISKGIILVRQFLKLKLDDFSKENNIFLPYLERMRREGELLINDRKN